MGSPDRVCNIPALQDEDGKWHLTPGGKADELARNFAMKGVLPDEAENEYSIIRVAPTRQGEVPMPTTEITEKRRNELKVSSGIGPDEVPARILRECSHELALPLTLLVIRILFLGVWPEIWKDHWIVPLHKRGVTFKSKQYRGVHLTAQISKVVERVVKQLFVPYLDRTGAFGPNQFAYRQHRGARDALALLVMRWIFAFNSGDSIILCASDVFRSGWVLKFCAQVLCLCAFSNVRGRECQGGLRCYSSVLSCLAL